MKDIIEFIKEEMSARGMTYDLLGKKAGMTKQNMWLKLNGNSRPNFETVVKILSALDYELTIEKKEGEQAPEKEEIQKFFESAEEEQVGYDCVEKLLAATGYQLTATHKSEKKVKKGIDTY